SADGAALTASKPSITMRERSSIAHRRWLLKAFRAMVKRNAGTFASAGRFGAAFANFSHVSCVRSSAVSRQPERRSRNPRRRGFVKYMALATLFSTLATTCADLGATLYAAEKAFDPTKSFETRQGPGTAEQTEAAALPRVIHIVIEGSAESTSPGILGFAFLAL